MKPGMKIIIMLVTAVSFWGGLFYFASCSGRPEKRAVEIAERALKATVDNPESIQIKGISKADSVFGKEYVNQHAKGCPFHALDAVRPQVDGGNGLLPEPRKDDTAMSDQVTRQLDAMTNLRALIAYGELEGANPQKAKEKKPFNGWKVKIDFEAKTLKGKPYHSEYWFILDKEAEIVVKSFEIPLL